MTRREFLAGSAAAGTITLSACREGRTNSTSADATSARTSPRASGATQVVLLDAGGPSGFGAYLEQILETEGLLGVRHVDAAAGDPASVMTGVMAVVAYGPVTQAAWLQALHAFVSDGGTLLAVLPGDALLNAFQAGGVSPVGGAALGGVSGVSFTSNPDEAPLRVHVAVQAGPFEWHDVAAWCVGEGGRRLGPAAFSRRVGRGTAQFWAFDVARNVALIRQGNPEWAARDRDGDGRVRLIDALGGWFDVDRLARPDADLLQRELVSSLAGADHTFGPLLGIDYFPHGSDAVMVTTVDAVATGAGVLERLAQRVEAGHGRLSIYYAPPRSSYLARSMRHARQAVADTARVSFLSRDDEPPSAARVDDWRGRGHEFMPLVPDQGPVDAGVREAWQAFADEMYDTVGDTSRTRDALWHGWDATAKAQATRGVRMNLDAWSIGASLRRRNGDWAHGHAIGSGLPQRFVGQTGEVVDCYQQPVQLVDAQLLAVAGGPEGLTGRRAAYVAESLIARAVSGPPAALGLRLSAELFGAPGAASEQAGEFLDATLAACRQHKVPAWPAARWLAFLDARRATSLLLRRWDAERGRFTCRVDVGVVPAPLASLFLPEALGERHLAAARVDGEGVAWSTRPRAARIWARIAVTPGAHEIEAEYR